MARAIVSTACLFLLLACAPPETANNEPAAQPSLHVSDARIFLPLPGRDVGVGYMVLENRSATAVTLAGVETDIARAVEIHTHTHSEGKMQMRRLDALTIAPRSRVELAPGGHHLMLFGLGAGLQAGDSAELLLQFGDGQVQRITADLRDRRQPNA